MPIYEYRCEDCRRRVSVLVPRMGQDAKACPRCGGSRLTRLWSRFALARSEESRLEKLMDDPALASLDENDPKAVAHLMRRMGEELGEDGGEDFEQALEEIERTGSLEGADEGEETGEDAGAETLQSSLAGE